MGDLIEFPRRLEWKPVEAWAGSVPNTQLTAKVERLVGSSTFTWFAWNGPMVVAAGTSDSLEGGKEAARLALERNSLVVRMNPLTAK